MNAIKTILNVLGALLAIPVAMLLAAWLMLAPVLMSAAAWLQPDAVKQIIRDIDYDAFLDETTADTPELEKLMKTEAVAEILELYLEDLLAQMEGKQAWTLFHEQAVRDTFEKHWDELLPIFRELLKEEVDSSLDPDTLSDEELKEMLRETFDETLPQLIEDMETAEELGIDVPEIRLAIQLLRSYRLTLAVVLVAVMLSVLLFLFRVYRLRGFIWLGVVYFITAGLTLIMSQGLRLAVAMMPAEVAVIGEQLLAVTAGKLLIGALIYGAVAIASVVAAVLYHNHLQKQQPQIPQWN